MALVFDIETIGEDYDGMDDTSKEILARWIKKTSKTQEEYDLAIIDLKNNLGFSPLTGEIVAIGVYDSERDAGCVYFQAPKQKITDFKEGNIEFKVKNEREILEQFWKLAPKYNEFVTFNGKKFDIPFMLLRSAINQIKPTKHLMSNRYLNSQRFDAKHIDLLDELTFYGAAQIKGANLHMFCRAFKIDSPKANGVEGDNVAELFKNGKYLEIARYNSWDIIATNKLFQKWKEYLRM